VEIKNEFELAQSQVKHLNTTPPPAILLELYSLYKQGSLGDVTGSRPGFLDIRGRAKFDAWKKKKGIASEKAQLAYVQLVNKLTP